MRGLGLRPVPACGTALPSGRPWAAKRLRVVVRALLCVLAVACVGAPAAFASNQVVQSPQPLESGCPPAAGKPPMRGSHCVPVAVSMIQDESFGPGPTCGQAVFMQVPLLPGIAEYGALWTNINKGATPWLFTASGGHHGSGSGPYGEEQYSTTALTPQNTGVNVNYKVPAGHGAWFVAAGGGPAPCDLRPGTAVAWAWTARYSVTGSVTIAGSGGVPVPNIRVLASCPSGATTTTNSLGDYEFLLDRGPCTIAPQLTGGKHATPAQRGLSVTRNFSNVDFQLPCNAIAGTAADLARASAARSACKLDVSVKIAPSTPHAGLVDDTSQNSPSFWAAGTSLDSQQAGSCLSGCVDLLVTVTNDLTHLPVEGAAVNAVVDPLRTVSGTSTIYAPYPTGVSPGFGFLCSPSPTGNSTTCGEATSATLKSAVTAQHTDVDGHVLLR